MADLETLRTRLVEAEAALHALQTTGATVAVEYDGRKIEYSRASATVLIAYIAGLKAEIARETGVGRRRAMRVTF